MEGILQSISKLLRSSTKKKKKKLLRRSGKRSLDELKQYYSSVLPEGLCRRFSLGEMKKATNDFADDLVIGEGGFGKVYKGFIDDRGISVAIKRFSMNSGQSVRELTNEVLLLCQLRHPNLIPLIGYCIDEGEGCLVYEFMVNGSLDQHILIDGTDHDPLPWKQRLAICIGVARGLHYLHTGLKHTIFHRDAKMSNILLDEKLEAKLGDFGLSKMGPPSLSKALIRMETSRIIGTLSYMAPEYAVYGELTDKSDVYSFGVILLQLLSGRKPHVREEQMDLGRWARKCKQEGNINEIIDPYLMGKIAPECFMVYVDIATSCVRNRGERRPTMGEVQLCLEHALELQDSADAATAAAGDCNYCVDEYTCNASSGDASPIDMVWPWVTASESTASAEELSLETAKPNGQI